MMRFIFTKEDRRSIRKAIDNFRQSYVIDTKDMLLESEYVESAVISTAQDYIVNRAMEKKLTQAAHNKKSQQVIYFNYALSPRVVKNIKDFYEGMGVTFEYALFDPGKEFNAKQHKLFDIIL